MTAPDRLAALRVEYAAALADLAAAREEAKALNARLHTLANLAQQLYLSVYLLEEKAKQP